MTPRITKSMAEEAIKSGAKVTEKRDIKQPGTKSKPKPAPVDPDIRALQQLVIDMTQAHQAQLKMAQEQNKQLSALIAALSADKPIRLKPIRDMKQGSPTYLLMQYLDVIPVAYKQKLDS